MKSNFLNCSQINKQNDVIQRTPQFQTDFYDVTLREDTVFNFDSIIKTYVCKDQIKVYRVPCLTKLTRLNNEAETSENDPCV